MGNYSVKIHIKLYKLGIKIETRHSTVIIVSCLHRNYNIIVRSTL